MKEVKKVTVEEIMNKMELLVSKGLTGCTFARINTVTTPKLNKKSRKTGDPLPFDPNAVRKVSEYVCGLGYSYDKSIHNKLMAENKEALKAGTITEEEVLAKYEAGETWHKAYNNSKVIREHKKTQEKYFYVQLNANTIPSVQYVNVVTGEEIPKDVLTDYLPTESAPTNQGLEAGNEVLVRTLKLSSLKGLSACNEEFEVI